MHSTLFDKKLQTIINKGEFLMSFNTYTASPIILTLDPDNPRFILPPSPTQNDIILYLLEYEEIIQLAKGINDTGGLMLGERVIVCKEDNKYIVLEGNRRICACKLLIDPSLIPNKFANSFPKVKQNTLNNIQEISLDVATSRLDAQSSLASKHIDGIRRWSTLSKQKFYAKSFDAGKTISEIAKITQTPSARIKKALIDYKLLQYALNLDRWTTEERAKYLNPQTIKPSPFLRVFDTKSIAFNESAKNLLKMSTNENTLEPISELLPATFQEAIYLIAKAAFSNKHFNTRSSIDDVNGLNSLLENYYAEIEKDHPSTTSIELPRSSSSQPILPTVPTENQEILPTSSSIVLEKKPASPSDAKSNNVPEIRTSTTSNNVSGSDNSLSDTKQKPYKPPCFFADLLWESVDTTDPENIGLLSVAQEIVNISKSSNYKKFPIASTILTRALLEQVLIHLLKKENRYGKLLKGNNNKTPPLEKLLDYCKKNIGTLIKDPNAIRSFSSFADNAGTKDYLDMVIHNPHLIIARGDVLDNIANSGLKSFIQYVFLA